MALTSVQSARSASDGELLFRTPLSTNTSPWYSISITTPPFGVWRRVMAHTIRDKKKLLNRVNRISGQVGAIKRALEQEKDCTDLLRTIAACRGAINGLMAEVIEGH